MDSRCGSCHLVRQTRLVTLEFSLPDGGVRHCETRLCGGCAAVLFDTLGLMRLAIQRELSLDGPVTVRRRRPAWNERPDAWVASGPRRGCRPRLPDL